MAREHCKQGIAEAARVFIDAIEFGFVAEALCRSERQGVNLQVRLRAEHATREGRVLNAQTLAALRSTTRQNCAAGTSSHASTETMRPLTMNFAGLVSALHAETRGENCAKTSTWWVDKRAARVRSASKGVKRAARRDRDNVTHAQLWITLAASV